MCVCHTYEYVTDVLRMPYNYAYVTDTYMYECHMSNLTRAETI